MFARLVVLTALLCIVLIGLRSGSAALYLSITVDPEAPRALDPAMVEVQTLAVFGENCLDHPRARATPMAFITAGGAPLTAPFELAVLGPEAPPSGETGTPAPLGRETFAVTLLQSGHDPTIWGGEIVFSGPGEWTLRVTFPDYGNADPECSGHEEGVIVLPSAPERLPDTATPEAIAAAR